MDVSAQQQGELPSNALVRPLRLIRLPEVIARVGIKRSMIYRLMGDGQFPRSRSLGPKCAVWVEAEIEDWILDVSEKRQP